MLPEYWHISQDTSNNEGNNQTRYINTHPCAAHITTHIPKYSNDENKQTPCIGTHPYAAVRRYIPKIFLRQKTTIFLILAHTSIA